MKKNHAKLISAVLTGSVLMICLSGCGEKDPYKVYQEASEKTSALKSVEAQAEISATLSMQGIDMEIPITLDMKTSDANTDDIKLDMQMSMEIMGQSLELSNYYTDGYYYMDMGYGSKIKYTMDLDELQETIAAGQMQTELKEEDFEELTMEKKDKEYILTFKISSDSINSIIDSSLSAVSELMAGSDMEMTTQDINGTMTVNEDGYISESTMTLPLTAVIEGTEMSVSMDMTVTYVDPGKDVTVELPDDLDSYDEVSLTDLEDASIIGGADGATDIAIEDQDELTGEVAAE